MIVWAFASVHPTSAQIYVRLDATGANDGTSWTDAYTDLQDALLAGLAGDEIWVARGTYKPTSTTDRTISFVVNKGLSVYGGFAGGEATVTERNISENPTILSGDIGGTSSSDNSYHVVIASNMTLDGLVITGGNADGDTFDGNAGGMFGGGTLAKTLANLTFVDNHASQIGGALSIGDATMTNVVFIGNSAARGGVVAVASGGSLTVTNGVFLNNGADLEGGAIHMAENASLVVTNATFVSNSGSGRAVFNRRGDAVVTNVIMSNHVAPAVFNFFPAVTTISHSLIEGSGGSGTAWDTDLGVDGGNNIDADPQLVDPIGFDVRLHQDSPAIDAGDNAVPSLPLVDLGGNPRIVNGTVDMGANEFLCATGSRICVDASAPAGGNGSSWASAYQSLTDAIAAACDNVTEIWVAAGTYTPSAGDGQQVTFELRDTLAVYGGFAGDETSLGERNVSLNPTVLSGNLTGGAHSFHVVTTSGTDATAILDGFSIIGGSASMDGGGLLNANGSPTIANIVFDSNTAGANGGAMATSSGAPTLTNIQFTNNMALNGDGGGLHSVLGSPALNNIAFAGNFALGNGGGMYNSGGSPVMSDVVFDGNSAGTGGGLYSTAGIPAITNAVFHNNTAANGGGIYNFVNSHAVLTNVIFTGNSAYVGAGGGMFNALSNPVVTNATFSGNLAPIQGGSGIYNSVSNPLLTNTILWGNTAAANNQIHNSGSTPVIAYSLIENSGGSGAGWDPTLGTDGGGNVDADPLFANAQTGDVHLTTGSAAIDAGDNNAPNLASTDIESNPRIIGLAVDMGAYEHIVVTGVSGDDLARHEIAIRSVFPNPFNPVVTVLIELDRAGSAHLRVYNVNGALVRELLSDVRDAGVHTITWNATDDRGNAVASGIYFLRLESQEHFAQRKLILLK